MTQEKQNNQYIGVIDIGSNSVRLVVYDGLKRVPMPVFNEKILCALATNMEKTGKLYRLGVKKAYAAISRYVHLCRILDTKELYLFATSAVRDAKDGNKFVEDLQKDLNVKIDILTGQKEAFYAGMGVLSSVTNPQGVVADLGGGSLELIEMGGNKVLGQAVSYPLGPLRLSSLEFSSTRALSTYLSKNFESFVPSLAKPCQNLYLVGGAFRNLAKIHMDRKNYPLKVIHHYNIKATEFLNTVDMIAKMPLATLQKLKAVSKKRLNVLPMAALIASRLIRSLHPENIVFSVHGVREGYLFDKLEESVKKLDPVIAGSSDIMYRVQREPDYGYQLYDFMSGLFKDETDYQGKLRLAACILSEISCFENTEYRADLAYRRIVDSSLVAINHEDRAFIATALYCRYKSELDAEIKATLRAFISKQQIDSAQIVGAAMRLGRSISASSTGVLDKVKLTIDNKMLVLQINKEFSDLFGSLITKRFEQLASKLKLSHKVILDV